MSVPSGRPPGPLPIPPEVILSALRNAETRVEEASALIRSLRLALESGDGGAAEQAASRLSDEGTLTAGGVRKTDGRLSGEGTLGAPATHDLSGRVDVRSDVRGDFEVVPSATAEGQYGWEGSATGTAPPEVTSWFETAKTYAPAVARVVETVVRLWTSAT